MFRRLVLYSSLIFILCACGKTGTQDPFGIDVSNDPGTKYTTEKAAMDVAVLDAEEGTGGAVIRWTRSPRLSLMTPGATYEQDLNNAISQINNALQGTGIQVQIGAEQDSTADILVYYQPMSTFPALCAAHGFPYEPNSSGYFWSFWNSNHEITHTVAMIATDVLDSSQMLSVTIEEVGQSMGPTDDQPYIPNSVYYGTDTDSGYATQMSSFDNELMHFMYTVLKPGYTQREVDYLFDVYWTE